MPTAQAGSGLAEVKAVRCYEALPLAQRVFFAQAGPGQRAVLREKGSVSCFDTSAPHTFASRKKAPAPSMGGSMALCLG